MTREEAIETLKLLKPNMRFDDSGWLYTKQALEMAIQALSQEPTDTWSIKDVADTFKKHGLIREQEPTDKPMCDRNICLNNEYNGIGCDECVVTKSQEPCDVFDEYGNYKYPSDVELTEPNTATSMPCTDAVSREAVIEWLKDKDIIKLSSQEETAIKELKALPSVTHKSGKWQKYNGLSKLSMEDVVICDQCAFVTYKDTYYKYCPNCGAKMVEPQERSGKE